MEVRFRQQLENKEPEVEKYEVEKIEPIDIAHEVIGVVDRVQQEKDSLKEEFALEKGRLLLRIAELERKVQRDVVCPSAAENDKSVVFRGEDKPVKTEDANQTHYFDESHNSKLNPMNSLSEFVRENRMIEKELSDSKNEILKLENQVKNLSQKLEDIEKLFGDGSIPLHKEDMLSQILYGTPRDINSCDDVIELGSGNLEAPEKYFDDIEISLEQSERTNFSGSSFKLDDLNVENEDLKRNVKELEQKLCKIVEENVIKIKIFDEKLDELMKKIMSGENSESGDFKLELVEDIESIRLEKTSNELLEIYADIVLRQKLTAPSPDILNANFCRELQSLESTLDIEIFNTRVFDMEMKDEVKQVLKDKERELLVTYTLEKLCDEIRHRALIEGTLEELQNEREKDFCVHQAVNEALRAHLGISVCKVGFEKGDSKIAKGSSMVNVGLSKEALDKAVVDHLGILNESGMVEGGDDKNKSKSNDFESLKIEKENLEKNLQELQEYFEKERHTWLEKLRSSLQGPVDPKDQVKTTEHLQAQKLLMEEIFNTERFHLSRLYYMEMREELKTSLKKEHFERSTKLEKDRFVDAWKHHVEIGELYQEILSKETEDLQNLQTNFVEMNAAKEDAGFSANAVLSKEQSRLEQQLPIKRELLELQRKRCRDHKTASLILEHAVRALETAARKQDTLLLSDDYFRRKSSWCSLEEEIENHEMQTENPSELLKEKMVNQESLSPNSSLELAGNSSMKDDLADALMKVFEKVIQAQDENNDLPLDFSSYTSDSEMSELETSSSRGFPSDDEGSVNSVNFHDASSTNDTQLSALPKATNHVDSLLAEAKNEGPSTESKVADCPSTDAKTADNPEGLFQQQNAANDSDVLSSVDYVSGHLESHGTPPLPVIFKVPARIENILITERFNMSRLLRDEYIDKIRQGRQKLCRIKAKNKRKTSELILEFQDEVKALLESMYLRGKEKRTAPAQRRKLRATPSYDSGIVEPTERDKDEVIKKFKELLKKARRDLNRAHKALRERNNRTNEVKNDIAAQESKNDLDELRDKRGNLGKKPKVLFEKIEDAKEFWSLGSYGPTSQLRGIPALKKDNEIPMQREFQSLAAHTDPKLADMGASLVISPNKQSSKENEVTNNFVPSEVVLQRGVGGSFPMTNYVKGDVFGSVATTQDAGKQMMKVENRVRKLSLEEMNSEEVKELQRRLGTRGNGIMKDLEEKSVCMNLVTSNLDEKFADSNQKLLENNERFEIAIKEGKDINELQRKLVQPLVALAKDEDAKSVDEEKCVYLEKMIKERKEKLGKVEVRIEALERKSIGGMDTDEIVERLQEKLHEVKTENVKAEERGNNQEIIRESENGKQSREEEVNELPGRLIAAATGGEETLRGMQNVLQKDRGQDSCVQQHVAHLQNEIERKEKVCSNEQEKIEAKMNVVQRQVVSGTSGEGILKELQEKILDLDERSDKLERGIGRKEKEFFDAKRKFEAEINRLQTKLVSEEDLLIDIKKERDSLQMKCEELASKAIKTDVQFRDEIRMKDNEIYALQNKLASGTAGRETLTVSQDKLVKGEKDNFQTKYEELECKAETKDVQFKDEVKEKDNKIGDLRKNLMIETGGNEVLVELQEELENFERRKGDLQTKCEERKGKMMANDERFNVDIKKTYNDISGLRKKSLTGTEEDIHIELPDLFMTVKRERNCLQTKCEDIKDKVKSKEEQLRGVVRKQDRIVTVEGRSSGDKEINELQKKLVSGTEKGEVWEEFKTKLKQAEFEHKVMEDMCSKRQEELRNEDIYPTDKKLDEEVAKLEKNVIDERKNEEVKDKLLGRYMVAGKEKQVLQNAYSEVNEKIEITDQELQTKEVTFDDLQQGKQLEKDLNETKGENPRLVSNNQKKGGEIVERLETLVAGSGGERLLTSLQTKDEFKRIMVGGTVVAEPVRTLQDKIHEANENNNALKVKCSDLESEAKKDNKKLAQESVKKNSQVLTSEECLKIIPEIKEEKNYWRQKYEALREKVGKDFVDIIPAVWNEETSLEKMRKQILVQLLELSQKLNRRESPVIKAISEKNRIETELSKVQEEHEACCRYLEQLHDIQTYQISIAKSKEILMECFNQLGIKTESFQECESRAHQNSEDLEYQSEHYNGTVERDVEQIHHEVKELVAERKSMERLNSENKDVFVNHLVYEKINTENELRRLDEAIQNLQKKLSSQSEGNSVNTGVSHVLGAATISNEQIYGELENIKYEINSLQSLLELELQTSLNGQEVNNLVALIKEKSKLEDELADTEKSLGQLGKREYESLDRERKNHEKVAAKLLELSRDKEVVEGELQELETLTQEKENQLLKNFMTNLKNEEGSETSGMKKMRGFGKKRSSLGGKWDDPGSISSAEEGFPEIDLEEPPLLPDATLALSEELGSLIHKKSSLAVRVEGLEKEISAQCLKVEKSLLGVKNDPSTEEPLNTSYSSVEDLTQSQISIFDDYNLVDKLSMAASVIRKERVKRKAFRKAPTSKLLKEKSSLEKQLKESQGKILVQNTRFRNAGKEGKDRKKAKEKFLLAIHDRKTIENELANVCGKIDDVVSQEDSVKDKKLKITKKGTSKNDKRRLFWQRKSLGMQLDAIKTRIKNFSLDGDDSGLADLPEMAAERNSIGNIVDRLRELIAREAELKQKLDRLTPNNYELSNGSCLNHAMIGEGGSEEMIIGRGGPGTDEEQKEHMIDLNTISNHGNTAVLNEEVFVMLNNDGKFEELESNEGVGKNSSVLGELDEIFDSKKVILEDLRCQSHCLSNRADAKHAEAVDEVSKREIISNSNNNHSEASLQAKTDQILKNSPSLQQVDSKAFGCFLDVMDILREEKAKNEARLCDLERDVANENNYDDKMKDADFIFQIKRDLLAHKMRMALDELKRRKQKLDESYDLAKKIADDNGPNPEDSLEAKRIGLVQQKNSLENELVIIKDEIDKELQSGEGEDEIAAEYQNYKDIKDKEKALIVKLDEVNRKLQKRKEWLGMNTPRRADEINLEETNAEIVKRMTEENLTMTDFIRELEEIKATLSKERAITRALLDLIKVRVGNELLEVLVDEGLKSPTIEILEMGMLTEDEYPTLLNGVENDSVTLAEIIDYYKKVNQVLFEENQVLRQKLEMLKGKVDDDLVASIICQDPVDIDISKKHAISKILENNKTLFELILFGNECQEVANGLQKEIKCSEMKLECEVVEGKNVVESDLSRVKDEMKNMSMKEDEGDEGNKRKEELLKELYTLEKGVASVDENLEIAEGEHDYSSAVVDRCLDEFNKSPEQAVLNKDIDVIIQGQNLIDVFNEETTGSEKLNDVSDSGKHASQPSWVIKWRHSFQEILSTLAEAQKFGSRVDAELERLNKEIRETEIGITERSFQEVQATDQDSSEIELKESQWNENIKGEDFRRLVHTDGRYSLDNREYSEDYHNQKGYKGLNKTMSSVEDLQKAFVGKLNEAHTLQQKLRGNISESLQDTVRIFGKESNELKSELMDVKGLNKQWMNDEEISKGMFRQNAELKTKMGSSENDTKESVNNLGKIRIGIKRDETTARLDNPNAHDKKGKNEEFSEVTLTLKRESDAGISQISEIKKHEEKLPSMKGNKKENESLRKLDKLENENKNSKARITKSESLDETLAFLRKENNELEDEIDYLRKEERDFNALNEKIKSAEINRENIEEELGALKNNLKEIQDFVSDNLNQDTEQGIILALEKYKETYVETRKQNNFLKEEVKKVSKIQNIVGERLYETLLEIYGDDITFTDTRDIPKCTTTLVTDKLTLACVLSEYESNHDQVKQHLGERLLALVLGKFEDLYDTNDEQSSKIVEELRSGRRLYEIVEDFETLINSHASNAENTNHLLEKIKMLELELAVLGKQRENAIADDDFSSGATWRDEDGLKNQCETSTRNVCEAEIAGGNGDQNLKSRNEKQNNDLMEYGELLKKVGERESVIAEIEQVLNAQTAKHDADKQKWKEQLNLEKSNMQQSISSERRSVEKAMQSLINEIVRLKENRNEIRKNNRVEKEKLVSDFENERAQMLFWYNEKQGEFERELVNKFQDDLEKVKKRTEAQGAELIAEFMKIRTERNELASKVTKLKDKVGNEPRNQIFNDSNEVESKEEIRNEFEEKMRAEKVRFQEILNSLKQEIEKLQRERSQAIDEISKQDSFVKQTTESSAKENFIYERLQSEFKAKLDDERMLNESRVEELRKEIELLNRQKRELKSSMRKERLELSKKYEQEKEELVEKYRNELRTLRKNLEKTQASHEVSTTSIQNFYELRRKIRDRDTKIKRYESFFHELNKEASMLHLQRDSD